MDDLSSLSVVRGLPQDLVFVDCCLEAPCDALVLVAQIVERVWHGLLYLRDALVDRPSESSPAAVVKDQGV